MDQENPHDIDPEGLDQPTPEPDLTVAEGLESSGDGAPELNEGETEPTEAKATEGPEEPLKIETVHEPESEPELPPPASEEAIELPRNVRVLIRIGLVLLALLALTSHISLAWLHSGDRFGIDHAAATWIALSHHAAEIDKHFQVKTIGINFCLDAFGHLPPDHPAGAGVAYAAGRVR